MKQIRPRPFGGANILSTARVIDIVAINQDRHITDPLEPGRQAAFCILFESPALGAQARVLREQIIAKRVPCLKAATAYPHMIFKPESRISWQGVDCAYLNMLLSDGADGWWPLLIHNNIIPSLRHYNTWPLPWLDLDRQISPAAYAQFILCKPLLLIASGRPYTCGKADRKKIRRAIREYLGTSLG